MSFTKTFFALFWMLCVVVMSHHYIGHVSDDGAIFLRYVENIIAEEGLVFNPGEYVEGYSSPLWLLLLCLFSIFVPVSVVPKVLGVVFLWCSFILLYKRLSHSQSFEIQQFIFGIVTLFGGSFYWMGTGMETPLLCFLWVGLAVFWNTKIGILFLSLLGIARPEGPLLVILGIFLWKSSNPLTLRSKRWFALFPSVTWFFFRVFYYGDILPNTYYAKTGGDFFTQISRGFEYTYQFFIPVLALGILHYNTEEKSITSVYVLIFVEVLVIFLGGGDWMLWGRMLVPLWFCWWLCFPRVEIKNPKHILLLGISLWGIWPLFISSKALQVAFDGRKIPIAGYQEGSLSEMSLEQAKFIQEFVASKKMDSNKITIAVNHAGFLPFYLEEYKFIDMTGLNNKYIAKYSKGELHSKYDVEYILEQEPDMIIFHSPQKPISKKPFVQGRYWEGESKILQDKRFWTHYEFQKNYWQRQGQGATILYSLLAIRKSNFEKK